MSETVSLNVKFLMGPGLLLIDQMAKIAPGVVSVKLDFPEISNTIIFLFLHAMVTSNADIGILIIEIIS